MRKYYFTYGSEGHPFYGGWTEIVAPDEDVAREVFRIFHPNGPDGFMSCSDVYEEEWFKSTKEFKAGNFGHRCYERISVTRTLCNEEGNS